MSKALFDSLSAKCSRHTAHMYSTSFSLGIRTLAPAFRQPVYSIYGFVRFADEIVDTFHEYDKPELLEEFERETYKAIERRISLNPILNSFQKVYHHYQFESELVEAFLASMRADLQRTQYDRTGYEQYIYGSAEVVGLMCLKVFCDNDAGRYQELKPYARSLGAAFQKVNFLRDLRADHQGLGRTYFPGISVAQLTDAQKRDIERDIEHDFAEARKGISMLPRGARLGVFTAFTYYYRLFKRIARMPGSEILQKRVRISNSRKMILLGNAYLRHVFNLV